MTIADLLNEFCNKTYYDEWALKANNDYELVIKFISKDPISEKRKLDKI